MYSRTALWSFSFAHLRVLSGGRLQRRRLRWTWSWMLVLVAAVGSLSGSVSVGAECIDYADTAKEARYLQTEYAMAYGSAVTVKKVKKESN